MKNHLLILAAITFSASCFAQSSKAVLNRARVHFNSRWAVDKSLSETNALQSYQSQTAQARHISNNGNQTSAVCNVVALGSAANASGAAGGSRELLSYDQNLNTVAFLHRAECGHPGAVTNTGYFTYDISMDGGTTWSINQGPIYGVQLNPGNGCGAGAVLGPHRARFPKGVIYNPAGNTNPYNAHLIYTGPWNTDILGITTWFGQVHGTGHFNGTAANENYDSLISGMAINPEDIFITRQGVSWIVGVVNAQDLDNTFEDSIAIYKGIWNGNDFVYSHFAFPYRINRDASYIQDMNIAFGDDGQTGYIAMITNQDSTYLTYPDSSYYIQVLKTIDGGQTWSCPQDLISAGALDSAMLVINGMNRYNIWADLDIVVDKNNNLHIVTEVIPNNFAAFNNSFQSYADRTYGIVDFFTTDQGSTWKAQLIAHPETFFSTFGTSNIDEIDEWLRPFASRTWDGSKLYFGWFDTDTLSHGIFTNQNPDLHLIGYDVDANMWTRDLSNLQAVDAGENITMFSSADGVCTFGNGSYYARDSGQASTVPVVYQAGNNPSHFFYVDCAAPTGAITYSGHALNIPSAFNSPNCRGSGDGVVLSAPNLTPAVMLVSDNYPNPYTGKTSVDITLLNAGDVSISISNVVGQQLGSATYRKLHTGLNTLTVDGSSLSRGFYFYTVKAGSNSITKTMTIQ
jgi:hypothetical protein